MELQKRGIPGQTRVMWGRKQRWKCKAELVEFWETICSQQEETVGGKRELSKGKRFCLWFEMRKVAQVGSTAKNGEMHKDLPGKEGEQDDVCGLQCRRLCHPHNTLSLAPRALGRKVECCRVTWYKDFNVSVTNVL